MYEVFFPGSGSTGTLEVLLVPLSFLVFAQKIVVHITYEKHHRLQEAMKMMGLLDSSYWIGYFIFDGVLIGFAVSFMCMIMSSGGLFNNGDLGMVLGLLWLFFLSVTPFSFWICSVFDTPQSAGQVTLAVVLGFYVLYFSIALENQQDSVQSFCCLFPPLALQLGCQSFQDGYDGISTSSICGMMVGDIFIYCVLAWYCSQVWPSELGVRKPLWFPCDPSYWFPPAKTAKPDLQGTSGASPLVANEIESQANVKKIPAERVNEDVVGSPSISINKLKKTFSTGQVAVNELSFDMYANQIFVLLGHNGAGKTTTINMLIGLLSQDYFSNGGATIYGYDLTDEMDQIRVCIQ